MAIDQSFLKYSILSISKLSEKQYSGKRHFKNKNNKLRQSQHDKTIEII